MNASTWLSTLYLRARIRLLMHRVKRRRKAGVRSDYVDNVAPDRRLPEQRHKQPPETFLLLVSVYSLTATCSYLFAFGVTV